MKNLEKQAIGIVAQLFDLAEVPVDKRQQINDVAYDYVTEQLIITNVSQCNEQLMAMLTNRVLTIQSEPDGIVRETMINNLLIDINCG